MSTNYFDRNLNSLDTIYETAVWENITSNYLANSGEKLIVYTSAAPILITLPANPNVGDTIKFIDAVGSFETNNLTVLRNGKKIAGENNDLIADVNDIKFSMTYIGELTGWHVN